MDQDISFDAIKSQRNDVERGLPFTLVARMEWNSALLREDTRKDYGERRFFGLGLIDGRLHAVVFTLREVKNYEQTQNSTAKPRH